MIADGLRRRRDRRHEIGNSIPQVGRAVPGVVTRPPQREIPGDSLTRREGQIRSVVYAAYLRRRSIRPLNRRVRLMEFAVQGNNFLPPGRESADTIDAICRHPRFISAAKS